MNAATMKKRNPVVAAFLSLLAPGMGHVYAGDLKKGLSIIAVLYGAILLGGFFGVFSTFYGITGFVIFIIGAMIFSIINSTQLALRNKNYHLKPYNRWYWYLGIYILTTLLTNILFEYRESVLGFESYHISTKSMEPTLQVSELVVADTRYHQPKVGDVIAFRYPKNRGVIYVKRIAALGGDKLYVENGDVIRNGDTVGALSVAESRRQSDFSTSMDEMSVPENEVFVLGDWRDKSNDSRFWGTVPVADIVGKVTYIWYSKDTSRIGARVK